jgi:zinc D-Ala-D-Ala carboxypeptidase
MLPFMGNGKRRGARAALTAVAAVILLTACASSSAAPSATPKAESTPEAQSSAPAVDQPTTPTPEPPTASASAAAPTEAALDRDRLSIDDPDSLWVVVNKLRPLQPADYEPSDLVDVPVPYVWAPQLRREASDAVVALFAAAADEGLQLASQSAYRSYPTQVDVYGGLVNERGQDAADQTSARPGHSEHQTGLAIDISALPANCSLDQCFADTPQGKWLAKNAWRFGFVLRYPDGATPITGYEYEPWHFRYVGKDLAAAMHDEKVATLEEFFDLPPAPDYAG